MFLFIAWVELCRKDVGVTELVGQTVNPAKGRGSCHPGGVGAVLTCPSCCAPGHCFPAGLAQTSGTPEKEGLRHLEF